MARRRLASRLQEKEEHPKMREVNQTKDTQK
jgi:hypothetical protein